MDPFKDLSDRNTDMLFAEISSETVAWLTAACLAALPVAAGVVGIIVTYRKGKAETRKLEAGANEEEAQVSAQEAKAAQKLRQEDENWAVKQARELYREVKAQMLKSFDEERLCQLRLATAVVRIKDLEDKLGIKRDHDEDTWAHDVLKGKSEESGSLKKHSRPDN